MMLDNIDMYFKKIEQDNMIYSIDKLRLKTYITYTQFSEIEFRFDFVWKQFVVNRYSSSRVSQFRYQYNLEDENGNGFWFGFLHNTEKLIDNQYERYNLTVEFNPNKIKQSKILMYLLQMTGDWYLRSFDLAIDIPINILDLIVDSSGRREMKTISRGVDNKTYYFGKNDGRVKIYNKKLERGLNIVGDLTRVEISREFDDFPIRNIKLFKFGEYFPTLYLNQYVFSFSDIESKNRTVMALLYAVQSGFPLKDLSRKYKDKIKSMLEGGSRIRFDQRTATQIFNSTIFGYFMGRGSKVVFL